MQRFGRTAQAKAKDGWGGSFILAAILALALAYWAGNAISQKFGGTDTAGSSLNGTPSTSSGNVSTGTATFQPRQYQLYFVQAAAFRSDSKARELMRKLSDRSLSAMVTVPDSSNLSRVFAGIYTSRENAESVKNQLVSDGVAPDAFIKPITVEHNPEAVPALATASKPLEVRNGLDALNRYLYEAAAFIEGRAATGNADPSYVVSTGEQLASLATTMSAEKDATVKQFAQAASDASANARELESAASAPVSSDEFQQAMSGYLQLLEKYCSLQSH